MAGRGDEVKGGIKQAVGKATGKKSLETEGSTQKETGRAKRKTTGAARGVKGGAKSALGGALDSPTMKTEGKADRVRGKVERS